MFISCIFFVSLHTLNFLNGQIVECPVHRVSVDHIRLTLACVQLLKMFTIKLILIRVPLWTQEMFHSPFGASRHMNNEMRVPSFVYASVCMCVCVCLQFELFNSFKQQSGSVAVSGQKIKLKTGVYTVPAICYLMRRRRAVRRGWDLGKEIRKKVEERNGSGSMAKMCVCA